MKKRQFKKLDNSISSFQWIKKKSEKYWQKVDLYECWGLQVQEGSKWKKGLSESELEDFQRQLNIAFPESLKNYYRTMNGLDKPGINNNGGEEEIDFGPIFYSYPDDISIIQSRIERTLKANRVTEDIIKNQNVPPIIPYLGHRFLILDHEETVLSMFGDDIIFWGGNLSNGIAKDIFQIRHAEKKKIDTNSFWNKKIG